MMGPLLLSLLLGVCEGIPLNKDAAEQARVAVFGGGISGLTAAHELAMAGYSVDVYESSERFGGKAVGYHNASGFPVEHSLRIITRGYISFFDMMDRIPSSDTTDISEGTAFDHNLTPLDMASMVSGKHDHSDVHMYVHVSETEARNLEHVGALLQGPADVISGAVSSIEDKAAAVSPSLLTSASSKAMSAVSDSMHSAAHYASLLPFGVFNPAPWVWDVRPNELLPFFDLILTYAESSKEQRWEMAGNESFADAIGYEFMTPQMQNYVTRFSGIVVAGRPYSSAHSMFNLWYHFMMAFPTLPKYSQWKASKAFMLNGPTSERLIDPWVKQLASMGVRFHLNSSLASFQTHYIEDTSAPTVASEAAQSSQQAHVPHANQGGGVGGGGGDNVVGTATLRNGSKVEADRYVMALPLRAVRAITGDKVLDKSFGTGNEWSVGFQFYIRGAIPSGLEVGRSVAMVMDSEWQLVYVVQLPDAMGIWKDVKLPEGVTAVLSATLSDVYTVGRTSGKSFFDSTPEECALEIIAQLGLVGDEAVRIAATGAPGPGVRYMEASALDAASTLRATSEVGPVQSNGHQWIAVWPLFIPLPGCQLLNATTNYRNLFMAGEMLSTPWFQVPTMEKAVESGKVCAQALVDSIQGQGKYVVPGLEFPGNWLQ